LSFGAKIKTEEVNMDNTTPPRRSAPRNPWITLLVLVFIFGTLFVFLLGSSAISLFGESSVKVTAKNSILHLELEGVILDGKKFIKQLVKYRKNDKIKAIVISINSPGGVVGPSQEIYEEIKRVREDYKKPVVVYSAGLMASGAFYAAVAADKIIVAPGTMMGSIGVIMEFMNMEKLYDWAKVKRYSINTGKFKDSGAEYRPMREDERALFQNLVNDVWVQFKDAVAEGRGLKPEFVNQYADGRVFTGTQGVKLGFADDFGTLEDAYDVAADLANLDDDYEVFEPPKHKAGIMDFLSQAGGGDDEDSISHLEKGFGAITNRLFQTQLANRPLYLMPGALD
jgi:protease-4